MIQALKGVIKLYPVAKVEIKKEKNSSLKAALAQLKNKEYETFQDFKSYKKAMNSNV
jgi:phosphoribosylcarboxyaminoimidazole (NCAIR) mutase